jgi:molybdate transport system ATP-binding protein
MISLEKLRWSSERFSLDLDARLEAHVTGLFGPSGAGKTTLIELIAGLRRPQAGTIRFHDQTLADAGTCLHLPPERRHLGYVPQDGALFPHLDVTGNLRYGAARGDAAHSPEFEAVRDLLGLRGLERASPTELSGGERQRVALGRALLSRPRALLLDEPLAGLDAGRKSEILPYLRRIRDEFKLPVIFVSHHPEDILALCDEVLVLSEGRLVARGAPGAVFEATSEPRYRIRIPLIPNP